MKRATIDYGIDLGTTNSTIGWLNGTRVEIIKNNEGAEYTPSAVWLDNSQRIHVGRQAKERLDSDAGIAFAEFKLQMGNRVQYPIGNNGQHITPIELSAEVLKSLKADVRQRGGVDLTAAVITVPAAFELPQIEATQKAAQLAGITQSPLLQEPVAAALAYGFQSQSNKIFWLVYDIGGGTFDAAVIHVRDGLIQVVNHGGDNHLGGKLLDWEIVAQLLMPALTQQYTLPDFRRGNPRWNAAIAKLKLAAEDAKIRVSRSPSTNIFIDHLCQDDRGKAVHFEYELQQKDVERLAEPYIQRSVNICRKILAEKRLNPESIEKVLLVGGPTMMPYLRHRLTEELQIPLAFERDPMTVVAEGAAIFAGTQRLTQDPNALAVQRQNGVFTISFPDWRFKGSDPEPLAAGIVEAPSGQQLQGFTVEFTNKQARIPWRSGKLNLAPNGAFMTTLWAERGQPNTFSVELCDNAGTPQQVVIDPHPLTYTVGLVIEKQPLIHSMGIALANNEVEWVLEKGAALPARRRSILTTTMAVRQGQAGDVIRIPVVEGDNPRADRNRRIGQLEIKAHQVKRDIPAGSEVEFTVEVDASRLVRGMAYIPLLDEEYEEVIHLGQSTKTDLVQLKQDVAHEKERLQKIQAKVTELNGAAPPAALARIGQEQMVAEVDSSLEAAAVDPDAADKADKRLLDLKVALDEAEDALEWPLLVAEAETLETLTAELIKEYGEQTDKQQFQLCLTELAQARKTGDADLLRLQVEEMRGLGLRILDRKGIAQVLWFQQLCEEISYMRDRQRAAQLKSQGLVAIQRNDIATLRTVNREMADLLPSPPPPPDLSTVMRT